MLGGLVSENASSGDAQAIEPLYALVLALLVGVGILSWPLVKFFVLAPQERFKFLDFTLLILSTSATLGFLTILFLDGEAYRGLKSLGESRLKDLANKLQTDFICEIRNMREQLMDFEKRALDFETPKLFDCNALLQGRRPDRADLFENCEEVGAAARPASSESCRRFHRDGPALQRRSGRCVSQLHIGFLGTRQRWTPDRKADDERREYFQSQGSLAQLLQ